MKRFTIKEILDVVEVPVSYGQRNNHKKYIEIRGTKIKINSHRLANFKVNGIKCKCCQDVGTHFIADKNYENGREITPSINLYTADGKLMCTAQVATHKASSYIDEYTTLCYDCAMKFGKYDRQMFKEGL